MEVDYSPILKKDPSGRCLAMQITKDKLAIIPFRQEHGQIESMDLNFEEERKLTNVLPSFIIDLHLLDTKIRNIKSIEFLHGYYEPTLAILTEPFPSWIG
jgi:cleavage and polyadenylation specificity factor subunit 1